MTKRRNMFPIMQIWICIERHFKSNTKRSKQQRVPSLSSSGQKYFVSTCSVVHYNKITISIMLILAVCVVSTASFLPHLLSTPSTCLSFSNDISVRLVPFFFYVGLMVRLQGCASQGGIIQSRNWLQKEEALGFSWHPAAIKQYGC